MQEFLPAGQTSVGFWCSIADPVSVEVVAASKPDYVCLDMQHGGVHEGNLVPLLQAVAAGGSVPIVRVAEGNPALIMKALDAGASGVIVPLVESAEQAARAVDACLYPPAGHRSYGPFRAAVHAGTADPRELEKVACVVMIETRAGIDNVEEIVATEGVTAAYVGPSDFSLALGLAPGSIDAPEFVAALDVVKAACERHGVVAGIHCHSGTVAARFIKEGFGMITVAVDLGLLRVTLGNELALARAAISS